MRGSPPTQGPGRQGGTPPPPSGPEQPPSPKMVCPPDLFLRRDSTRNEGSGSGKASGFSQTMGGGGAPHPPPFFFSQRGSPSPHAVGWVGVPPSQHTGKFRKNPEKIREKLEKFSAFFSRFLPYITRLDQWQCKARKYGQENTS